MNRLVAALVILLLSHEPERNFAIFGIEYVQQPLPKSEKM